MANVSSDEFSVQLVFQRSLSTLISKNLFDFVLPFLLGLILMVTIGTVVLIKAGAEPGAWNAGIVSFMLFPFTSLVQTVMHGIVAYMTNNILQGKPASLIKSMFRGTVYSLPLAALVVMLAAVLGLIFSVILPYLTAFILTSSQLELYEMEITIGYMIGGMIIILPLWCIYGVSIPISVIERLGPIQCLKRSMELTDGLRLELARIYVVLAVVLGLGFFVPYVFDLSGALRLIEYLPLAFFYITATVTYVSLREVKENFNIKQQADTVQ